MRFPPFLLAASACAVAASLWTLARPPSRFAAASSFVRSAAPSSEARVPGMAAARETTEAATLENQPDSSFRIELDGRLFPDPASAIRAAESGPADLRLAAYLQIADAWGPENVADAARWAASLSDPSERADVLVRLGEVILPVSPETAFFLADKLPPGTGHDRFFRSVVHCWAKENPSAAAEGLPRVGDSRLQAELQSAIAFEWAQRDPQGAATYVADRMPPGEAQASAARTVALRWMHLDPGAARSWIASFPVSANRDELLALIPPEASSR